MTNPGQTEIARLRRLIRSASDLILDVTDRVSDELDRVYLGSTNDVDRLRRLGHELQWLDLAPAEARSASPWLDICDARHDDGVVLIRFQSGECCAAYLTERLPPLVQTWRYAFAPCRGQQAPWPVAWMPIPKAETDHG